ncbi:MAG: serine hydrolase domain-containing protein [Candidatus Cybelea sp.]
MKEIPLALGLLVLSIACLGVTAATSAAARPPLNAPQIASIDRFMEREMAETHVPGAAVGIYSRGTILLAKGYGLANVELNVPVKPQTIFQSGSVGKQFVSAAIMMLVQEGRISLDDSIAKYFPNAPASWKPIEIKNLLSHTSGLAEYESSERTGPSGPFYLRLDFTENELLAKIEALPIESPPGVKWDYRNTNYVLLGMVIHRVTGMFYADYLAKHIFEPLGMTTTRLISDQAIIPNRAAGYQWGGGKLANQDWVSPTFNSTADGTLYFTVLDLAKWDAALYGTQLLSRTSLDRIWTVYRLNDGKPNPAGYGFGWGIGKQNGHRLIEHGGAWQGFTCQISRYPDDSLTVVVLTNLDADHARPDYAAHVIAGLVDPALLPARLVPIADTQPRIAALLRSTFDAAVAGKSLASFISPDFAKAIPNGDAVLRKLLAGLWPDGNLVLVDRRPEPDDPTLTFSEFRLTRGSKSTLVNFGLNAKGQIDALWFEPNREYNAE